MLRTWGTACSEVNLLLWEAEGMDPDAYASEFGVSIGIQKVRTVQISEVLGVC